MGKGKKDAPTNGEVSFSFPFPDNVAKNLTDFVIFCQGQIRMFSGNCVLFFIFKFFLENFPPKVILLDYKYFFIQKKGAGKTAAATDKKPAVQVIPVVAAPAAGDAKPAKGAGKKGEKFKRLFVQNSTNFFLKFPKFLKKFT